MVIKEINIHGCNRFALNNIKNIKYTPKSIVQIIIGSNGSGKSSLMDELSLLPSDLNKRYTDTGSISETIIDNKDVYVLESGVRPNKHNFKYNGKECNVGGTKRVQEKLVFEHFKIDKDINNLILDKLPFTKMSGNDKKNWLTRLSSTDFDYLIGIFNRAKTRNRDLKGALKITTNDMNISKALLVDEVTKRKYIKDLRILTELLELVISNKDNNTININNDLTNLDMLYVKYSNLYSNYIKVLNKYDRVSYDKVDSIIDSSTVTITDIDKSLLEITKQLEKINTDIDVVTINNSKDILIKKIKEIKEINEKIVKNNVFNINLLSTSILDTYETNITEIQNNVTELMSYDRVDVNEYLTCLAKKNELLDKLQSLITNKNKYTLELSNHNSLKNDSDTTCVKCGHTWKIGYSPEEHQTCIDNITKLTKDINLLNKDIDIINEKCSDIDIKKTILNNLKHLFTGDLVSLYNTLDNHTSSEYTNLINRFNIFTNKIVIYQDNIKELNNNLIPKMNLIDNTNTFKIGTLEELKVDLNNRHNTLVHKKILLEKKIEDCKVISTIYKNLNVLRRVIKMTIKNNTNVHNDRILKLKNNTINKLITTIKYSISEIETSLNQVNINNRRYLDYKVECSKLKIKVDVTSRLIYELSPVTGLIGESIATFTKVLTTEMNTIINKVWTYPMKVLPCSMSDTNELNYIFPILVGNNKKLVPDIKETSTGQQEIINLAFKLVALKYLGLKDYPLYLDEFGRTMDDVHRDNAYNVLNSFIQSGQISQVFIVSQFVSMYGRFKNADINILASENIHLSDNLKYNERMVIT